jgi:SAM-dependent methyltransferase
MKYYPPRFLFRRYELLKRLRGGNSFLEIGPGNLYLTQDLLGRFKRGTVLDYSPWIKRVYDGLPDSSKRRLDLVTADFMALGPCLVSYDCVVACEVLEHAPDDEAFLDKMCDFLEPRGQLALSVPSRMKFWSLHDELAGHLRRYEKDAIIGGLSDRGFANIEVASYGFPFVNILRCLRIALAHLWYDRRADWTQVERTQESGVIRSTPLIDSVGLICNKYTSYPFSLIASLFNCYDLSDGYVITAEKPW